MNLRWCIAILFPFPIETEQLLLMVGVVFVVIVIWLVGFGIFCLLLIYNTIYFLTVLLLEVHCHGGAAVHISQLE